MQKKARRIRLLLLDVDGVLTDGAITVDGRGEEIKRFDVRDGHRIKLLIRAGIQVGLITGRSSKALTHRARELGIRMLHRKVDDKLKAYEKIKKKTGLKDQEIAYVGDDITDLPVLRNVGLAIAVRDSWAGLERAVDYVTARGGGRGAVQEVIEILLRAQGRWGALTKAYYE